MNTMTADDYDRLPAMQQAAMLGWLHRITNDDKGLVIEATRIPGMDGFAGWIVVGYVMPGLIRWKDDEIVMAFKAYAELAEPPFWTPSCDREFVVDGYGIVVSRG